MHLVAVGQAFELDQRFGLTQGLGKDQGIGETDRGRNGLLDQFLDRRGPHLGQHLGQVSRAGPQVPPGKLAQDLHEVPFVPRLSAPCLQPRLAERSLRLRDCGELAPSATQVGSLPVGFESGEHRIKNRD